METNHTFRLNQRAYWTFRLVLIGWWLACCAPQGYAQLSAHKGQTVFIYNFTKYVKWPGEKPTLVIGVLGESDILAEMTANMKGKKAGESTLDVRKVTSITEAAKCDLVYVPASHSKELETLVNAVQGKGVLVVSEEDLATKGAGISFLFIENKLRFKINSQTIKKAGLQVSNNLLGLAIVI